MIRINNLDITHYNLADLRCNISYVTNNVLIENKSLLENITMGKTQDINNINKVLKVTGLDKILANKNKTIYTIIF